MKNLRLSVGLICLLLAACNLLDKKPADTPKEKPLYQIFNHWPVQKFSGKWKTLDRIQTRLGTQIVIHPDAFMHTDKSAPGDSIYSEIIEINALDSFWYYGILTETGNQQPLSFIGALHLQFRDENGPLFLKTGHTIPVVMRKNPYPKLTNYRIWTGAHDSRYAVVWRSAEALPLNASLLDSNKLFFCKDIGKPLVRDLEPKWKKLYPDTILEIKGWIQILANGNIGYVQASGAPDVEATERIYAYLKNLTTCTPAKVKATEGGFVKFQLTWNPKANSKIEFKTQGTTNQEANLYSWKEMPPVQDSGYSYQYLSNLGWNAIATTSLPDNWKDSESILLKDATGRRINRLWKDWNVIIAVKE